MRLAPVGLLLSAFFFGMDLRIEETPKDQARNERSCEPKAKGRHCDGA